MAATAFSSTQTWVGADRGVQLFGIGAEVGPREAAKAEAAYGARFPEYARWQGTATQHAAARQYRLYGFQTAELKVLDEEEFGDAVFMSASVSRGSHAHAPR